MSEHIERQILLLLARAYNARQLSDAYWWEARGYELEAAQLVAQTGGEQPSLPDDWADLVEEPLDDEVRGE